MGASYAGDRLQELAQVWLEATLAESSALAVGGISILSSLPQLLMPAGRVIVKQFPGTRLHNRTSEDEVLLPMSATGLTDHHV